MANKQRIARDAEFYADFLTLTTAEMDEEIQNLKNLNIEHSIFEGIRDELRGLSAKFKTFAGKLRTGINDTALDELLLEMNHDITQQLTSLVTSLENLQEKIEPFVKIRERIENIKLQLSVASSTIITFATSNYVQYRF